MMQVSGLGEASKKKLMAASEALSSNMAMEGAYNHEYTVRATRKRHPDLLMPVSAKNNEDRRVDRLTYNISTHGQMESRSSWWI